MILFIFLYSPGKDYRPILYFYFNYIAFPTIHPSRYLALPTLDFTLPVHDLHDLPSTIEARRFPMSKFSVPSSGTYIVHSVAWMNTDGYEDQQQVLLYSR